MRLFRIDTRIGVWGVLAVTSLAMAQATQPTTQPALSVDAIRARLDASPSTQQANGQAVRERLGKALTLLQQREAYRQRADEFRRQAAAAPATLQEVRNELNVEPTLPTEADASRKELPQIEQTIDEIERRLQDTRQQLESLQVEPARRKSRTVAVNDQLTEARARLEEINRQMATVTDVEDEQIESAEMTLLQARLAATQSEINMLQAEQDYLTATDELVRLRQDLASRRVNHLEETLAFWQKQASARRSAQARQIVTQARQLRDQLDEAVHDAVKRMAEENIEISRQLTGQDGLAGRIRQTRRQLIETRTHFQRLDYQYRSIRQKVDIVGLNESVGRLLREQRQQLGDAQALFDRLQANRDRLSDARMLLLDFQARRAELANLSQQIEAIRSQFPDAPPDPARLRNVLDMRKVILDRLITELETYTAEMDELVSVQRELLDLTHEIADYIDERVLWIRSAEPLGAETLKSLWDVLGWLGRGEHGRSILKALWTGLAARPLFTGLSAVVLLGLLVRRRKALAIIRRIDEGVRSLPPGHFRDLGVVLLLTLWRAMVWPAVFWLVGATLTRGGMRDDIAAALGEALIQTAILLWPLTLLSEMARPGGLGRVHLHWNESLCQAGRPLLHKLIVIFLPLSAIASLVHHPAGGGIFTGVGRLAFILSMLVVAGLVAGTFRPSRTTAMFSDTTRSNSLHRYRWAWYLMLVGLPLLMAIMNITGYAYTARQIALSLRYELVLLIIALLIYQLLNRVIYMGQRLMAQRQSQEAVPSRDEQGGELLRDMLRGLSTAGQNIRRLIWLATLIAVGLGSWMIWERMLPALGMLRRISLYSIGEGNEVTLGGLLAAGVAITATIFITRSVPGLLNAMVMERFEVEIGKRYAIKAVLQYLLATIGVIITFQYLGVSWSSVQWIVAAMGVGLGFGLQEIVANFVSGLILLIERPIRVGDIVTVGGVSGTVSRIRIRATTVVDFDRKELIIPNKEFITKQLVNWSLSDRVLRLTIPVGVAYGSDTEQTCRSLQTVGENHPLVVADPAPQILFLGFGDNTLQFELRVFISDVAKFLSVTHELHMAVDREFRKQNITIAFPQRDVHLFLDDREGMGALAKSLRGGTGPDTDASGEQ
jgi:potassium efflux system protein